MEINYHEVDFNKYCPLCEHYKLCQAEDPCNDCLGEPANVDSRKPLYFKAKDPDK